MPIKRCRRTQTQVEQLELQIYEVLAEDHPQSVRHVFYRMTNPRLPEPVEKTDRGYRQVQGRITKMRRKGALPYGWITDATRRGYHVETFSGPEECIRQTASLYRLNPWEQARHYCEVWCESRSIAGVIEDVCEELAVSLYPAGGFSSLTLAYDAARIIASDIRRRIVPVEIIYIGDLDPAGVLIDRSIENELREHLPTDIDLNFHRIAITEDQIAKYDLPTKPRKMSDNRSRHITETVEAEAMPAGIMRQLLREKIESYLPADALKVTHNTEEGHRIILHGLADMVGRNRT